MKKLLKYLKYYNWLIPIILLLALVPVDQAHAEKGIYLSAAATTVEVDKTIDVPIVIDTGGEAVNAVGFTIDFPTENLEGLVPNRANSSFNWWVIESATRIDCGTDIHAGFTGNGLITTLRFKGRKEGDTNITLRNISVIYNGTVLNGFVPNDINISVIGTGMTPAPTEAKHKITLTPPSDTGSTISAPAQSAAVVQTPSTIPNPTQTFGSIAQVKGTTGATSEDVLKPATVVEAEASVKGLFSKNSILWTSVLPTAVLIIIIVFLGIRLYFNERKRHLNMERIFDKQLGTLATLESKIDIIEQSGANGREQYIEELETAKKEIITEAGSDIKASPKLAKVESPAQGVK